MITSTEANNKRIAANTLLLYVRMLFTMGLGFFSTRALLDSLGAVDFGLLNVIAGVVSMFGFLSSSMNAATSRFFSFELGKGDQEKLARTFSMICIVFAVMVVAIIVVSEIVGIWVLENKLVIPAERMNDAWWLFQGALLSFAIGILTLPYNSLVLARENMGYFSVISVIDSSLKFGIACSLHWIPANRLSIYGGLLVVVSLCTYCAYRLACLRCPECRFRFCWDTERFKELIGFSGWNLFGSLASVVNGVLVNVLLNIFFGPVVNAARGIAFQTMAAVSGFTGNFMQATNPQIVKYYAEENLNQMRVLVSNASRYAFLLLFAGVLPLFWKTEFVLGLWLKTIPADTIIFVRLVLVMALVESYSYPLITGLQATGRIALYQSIVGSLIILNFPVSYLFLKLGFKPESVFYIAIAISILAFLTRLVFLRVQIRFPLRLYFREVMIATLVPAISGSVIVYLIDRLCGKIPLPDWIQLAIGITISCSLVYRTGLKKSERNKMFEFIKQKARAVHD